MNIPTGIPYKLIGIGVAISVLLGTFGWLIHSRDGWRDTATTNEQLYHGEQAAHQLTVANYRAQAAAATAADAAHKAKVEADQKAVTESTDHEYEARIADARARADSLRKQLAAAASGHPGSPAVASVPSVPGATSSPGSPATQDGLSPDDALTATEQAIQLDELIKWVTGQTQVNK